MYPRTIDWQALRFGVELEFVGIAPSAVERLPGWTQVPDDRQFDDTGAESGGEIQSPPLGWSERDQIRAMLDRLVAANARVNWSCGLHVHVGLEPWGEAIVVPLLDAAIACQPAVQALMRTPEHRLVFCPPVAESLREAYLVRPERLSLVYTGRPESHRCGINVAAWFDNGTVEFRYANATLDYDELLRTVEFCLRFVAAVGAGRNLPGTPEALAEALGAPRDGYPAPQRAPLWHMERMHLADALVPVLSQQVERLVPGGEILSLHPVAKGLLVAVESDDNRLTYFRFFPRPHGWEVDTVAIRKALPEDAETVQHLLHEAYGPDAAAGFNFTAATIDLPTVRERIRTEETYLLLESGEVCGTITLFADGSFGSFAVRSDRKGQGHGSRLLTFAEERARMKGWTTLRLDTPIAHPWLPAFYERRGFRPVGTVRWEGKRYESVLMEKPL